MHLTAAFLFSNLTGAFSAAHAHNSEGTVIFKFYYKRQKRTELCFYQRENCSLCLYARFFASEPLQESKKFWRFRLYLYTHQNAKILANYEAVSTRKNHIVNRDRGFCVISTRQKTASCVLAQILPISYLSVELHPSLDLGWWCSG